MGVLRDQMIRELQLRRHPATTQKAYLEAVVGLTVPDQIVVAVVAKLRLYGFWCGRWLFAKLVKILETRSGGPNLQRICGYAMVWRAKFAAHL